MLQMDAISSGNSYSWEVTYKYIPHAIYINGKEIISLSNASTLWKPALSFGIWPQFVDNGISTQPGGPNDWLYTLIIAITYLMIF